MKKHNNTLRSLVGMGVALALTGVSCLAQDTSSGSSNAGASSNGVASSNGGWRRFEPNGPAATDANGSAPAAQFNGPAQPPAGPSRASASVPSQITVPAGTWISVRVNEPLSSKHNHPGDSFSATLAQPLVADGFVLARRGETIAGRIAESDEGGRVKGVSHLAMELTDLSLVDGQQLPVRTELARYQAGTSKGRDAAAIAGTTGVGAAIGAAAAGGVGAAAGAGAGAVASVIGVLATHGRETVVFPEDMLTFRLTSPVTISTDRSAQAFQPVSQQDYEQRPQLQRRVVAGPRPYYYGAPYPYWGPYGYGPGFYGPGFYGPSIGFYGRFGGRRR